jgi:hypothetical protein
MVADDRRAYRLRGGSCSSSLVTGAGSDVVHVVVSVVGEAIAAGATKDPSVAPTFSVSSGSALASESVISPTSFRVTEARRPLRSRGGEIETGERFIGMVVDISDVGWL